jgi:hypothetical protein
MEGKPRPIVAGILCRKALQNCVSEGKGASHLPVIGRTRTGYDVEIKG